MDNIVNKEDFGDIKQYEHLSSFDWLLIVADKARQKEGFSSSSSSSSFPSTSSFTTPVPTQTRKPIQVQSGRSEPGSRNPNPPMRAPHRLHCDRNSGLTLTRMDVDQNRGVFGPGCPNPYKWDPQGLHCDPNNETRIPVAQNPNKEDGYSHSGQNLMPIKKNRAISRTQPYGPRPDPTNTPGSGLGPTQKPDKENRGVSKLGTQAPPLPTIFRQKIAEMGGSDPELVIQKPLFESDVSTGHGRLALPVSQSKLYLTKEDVEKMKRRDERGKFDGFDVEIIEPGLDSQGKVRVGLIRLKIWECIRCYVLNHQWNDLRARNQLKNNDVVQLWSFRVSPNNRLCFALVKVN